MASISFPTNPTNGDTYTYNGVTYEFNSAKSQWIIQVGTSLADVNINSIGGSMIPSANVTHDLGTSDKAFRDLYLSGSSINLGGATISSSGSAVTLPAGSTVGGVTIGTGSGGATQYANASLLPTSGLTAGEFAFVGNTLFMTNGSGWYSVALINQTPELTLSTSSIVLGNSGNTINFTFTATDPDGPTPTVTATTTANSSQANVTVYSSNNTVTVENLSVDGYSANITVTASDGINQTFGTVILNVRYLSELWDETVLSIGTSSTNSLDNSTFIDRSTNTHTVTPTGTPVQTAFHPYLDNWSVEFDGTGDYLTAPTSTDFSFDGDFTVESWVYLSSTSASAHICDFRVDTLSNNIALAFSSSTGTFVISIQSVNAVIGTTAVLANQWYHIAAVRNSDTITLYVNGSSEDSVVNSNTFANYTNRPTLGAFAAGTPNLIGFISNFRVIKGTAVYTSNFTPPTEKLTAVSGTSLLTCQSNRFIDNSTNDHTITVNGDPEVSSFNPFGQDSEYASDENKGSIEFENNNQISASGSIVDVGTGDYTVEFWCYGIPNDDIIIDMRDGTGNTTGAMLMSKATGFRYQSGSTNTASIGPDPALKQWLHIAVVRSSGNVTYYANGIGELLLTGDTTNFTGTTVTIGASNANAYDVAEGYCSDLKITQSAVYTSNFTPPTSPVGNTNAELYLPFDNAGIFDKTSNYTLTPSSVVTSTTQTKYASSALSIGGTGNRGYVILPSSTSLLNANDIVTIEGWVYFSGNNSGDNPGFFGSGLHIFPDRWVFDLASNGGNIIPRFVGADNNPLSNGTAISAATQQWHHIAVVNNPVDNYFKAYVNGTLSISITAQSQPLYNSQHEIGAGLGSSSVGGGEYYIENFQILKGVAKYTTNFTPPNKIQGREYQAES